MVTTPGLLQQRITVSSSEKLLSAQRPSAEASLSRWDIWNREHRAHLGVAQEQNANRSTELKYSGRSSQARATPLPASLRGELMATEIRRCQAGVEATRRPILSWF